MGYTLLLCPNLYGDCYNNRATLVGSKTFGKGSIESVRRLSDKQAGIAVSVGRYLTPGGRNINKHGIDPDIKVELTEDQKKVFVSDLSKIGTSEDPQFMRALKILNNGEIEDKKVEPKKVQEGNSLNISLPKNCRINILLEEPIRDAEIVAKKCLETLFTQRGNSWFTWYSGDLEEWNSDTSVEIKSSELSRADELNGLLWKGFGTLGFTARRVKKQNWSRWEEPDYERRVIKIDLEYVEGIWKVTIDWDNSFGKVSGDYRKPKDNELLKND